MKTITKSSTLFRRACLSLLLLAGMAVNARAEMGTLYVCGIRVTEANYRNLTPLLSSMGYLKSGSVKFDGKRTLTLSNAVIEKSNTSTGMSSIIDAILIMNGGYDVVTEDDYPGIDDLTIVVEGNNQLSMTSSYMAAGIYTLGARLIFRGSGKLSLSASATTTDEDGTTQSMGIANMMGDVVFMSGTYNIKGGYAGAFIYSPKGLVVGGGDVTFEGDHAAVTINKEVGGVQLSPFAKYMVPASPGPMVSIDSKTNAIADAAGNIAKRVQFGEKDADIYLFVGGNKVTRQNKADVLGNGGSVMYDGTTLTLTDANFGVYDKYDVEAFNVDDDGNPMGVENLEVKLVGDNTTTGKGWQLHRGTKIGGNPNYDNSIDKTIPTLTAVADWGFNFADNLTVSNCTLDLESRLGGCMSGYTNENLYMEATSYSGVLHVDNATVKAHCQRQQNGVYPMNYMTVDDSGDCGVLCPAGCPGTDIRYFWDGTAIVGPRGKLYPLSVCGIRLCEGNAPYLNEGLRGFMWLTQGSVSFDPASKTLTMEDAELEYFKPTFKDDAAIMNAFIDNENEIFEKGIDGLTIKVKGNNKIKTDKIAAGIFTANNTVFDGDGKLSIEGDGEDDTGGISSGMGSCTFKGGEYSTKNVEHGLAAQQLVINGGRFDLQANNGALSVKEESSLTLAPGMFILKPTDCRLVNLYGSCYVAEASGERARHVVIGHGGIATSMTNAAADQTTGTWNTLGGQRINAPTQKGIYLMNGKKVIVK